MAREFKIGFPPPMLGPEPVRLDVLEFRAGKFAVIAKPANVLLESDIFNKSTANIISGLKAQEGKPELSPLEIEKPFCVHHLDCEMSGAALIALGKEASALLRNSLGSGEFAFEYMLLCEASETSKSSPQFDADLPILLHEAKPRMIVSHRFGKGARTSFEFLSASKNFELWRAWTNFPRPHQVRIHAAERGLKIVGESLYADSKPVLLSNLKKSFSPTKGFEEKPVYDGLCAHLQTVSFAFQGENFEAPCPLPKKFEYLLKRLSILKEAPKRGGE